METYTLVTAPSERYVVIHDVRPGEAIPIHAFEYYNRRLGLADEDRSYEEGDGVILPFSAEDSEV